MGRVQKIKQKVFVMMSGGVDSSTATFLLSKNKNYEVIGCFIKGYNLDGCQAKEAEDARKVAEYLNIPFYVVDLEKEYKKLVVDYMVNGYKKGITPNPDVMCNSEIKFGLFLKKALKMGADFVATGHYVRLKWKIQITKSQYPNKSKNKNLKTIIYQLQIARDLNKDQSYFLWKLTQDQLKHCIFPIGDYTKPEIRKIAKKAGLPTADKKDSQGICFLGQVSMKDFLKTRLLSKKGDIVISEPVYLEHSRRKGNREKIKYTKIGEHDGAWFYTIGQRHGLSIGERNQKSETSNQKLETRNQKTKKQNQDFRPYFVAEKNIKKNLVIVAEGENNPNLYKKEVELTEVNLNYELGIKNYGKEIKIPVLARVRYRQPLFKALFIIHNSKFKLFFEQKQRFVAPGQSAVFYDKKDTLLGGGVIAPFKKES